MGVTLAPPARPLAAALAAAVVAAAVYAPTLGHGFALDDGPEVVDNASIRSLANVPALLAEPGWHGSGEDAPIYRPLTTATYALDFAIGGLAPAGYHAVNVLLHALASALVVLVAIRLGLTPAAAALAGLLFAVHPVHAEVVANVAGRKDALTAVFLLAALLAHGTALRRGGAAVVLAPAALAAAMLSKETGVVGIAVLAAWDLLLEREAWRRGRRRALALYAAYAAVTAGYLVARWRVVGSLGVPLDHIPFLENPLAHVPASVRILTAIAVLGRGLLLLVAPVTLAPDYSWAAIRPVASATDPAVLASAAAVSALAIAAVRLRARRPALAFAILWYGITILPGANLLTPVGTIFGERLLYVPSVGFCLAVAALAGLAAESRAARVVPWVAAAALAALGVRTVAQASVWRDERSLYAAGVAAQPESTKMHQLLGAVLMEQGRPDEALPHFERVLELLRGTPAHLERHLLERGYALEQLGRLDDAARSYEDALRAAPSYADAQWRLGDVRWAQGRRPEAIAAWGRTVELEPRHARALSDLGIAASLAGDDARARALWERAAAADPRLASVWYRLGDLYARAGEPERARAAWARFLEWDQGVHPAWQAEVERRMAAAR
jgi:tetratricopeptide (TPR) repeat protein